MALHFLNLSIDAPDIGFRENLNHNEQESVVEFVLEKMLHIENAVPEYDDDDNKKTTLKKKSSLSWFTYIPVACKTIAFEQDICLPSDFNFSLVLDLFREIPVPPPKY